MDSNKNRFNIGMAIDVDAATKENNYYRHVIFTSKYSQLVLMSLQPKEEIGLEVHEVDQFVKIESGSGLGIIGRDTYQIKEGVSLSIPAGMEHNITNTGKNPLKLYTIYSPPQHPDNKLEQYKTEEK